MSGDAPRKISRRTLLKGVGTAGAAAVGAQAGLLGDVAAPALEAVQQPPAPLPTRCARTSHRGRSRYAGCDRRAHHPHRRPRSWRQRSASRTLYRPRARRRVGRLAPGIRRRTRRGRRVRAVVPPRAVPPALQRPTRTRFSPRLNAERLPVLPAAAPPRSSRWCGRTRFKARSGDPYYGGNANFVGWDLIGYPGVRRRVTPADQRMNPRSGSHPQVGVRLRRCSPRRRAPV